MKDSPNRPCFRRSRGFAGGMSIALTAALSCAVQALSASSAQAQTVFLNGDDVVSARFLTGWRLENGHHLGAVAITLADGWKTYWRSPGDGGLAPELTLGRSSAIEGAWMHFPRPEVIFTAGTPNIGYRQNVIFPIELDLVDGAGDVAFFAELHIGVCDEICMPVTLELEGVLNASGAQDPVIAAALADQPTPASEIGAGPARCDIRPIADGLQVTISARLPDLGGPETMMLELPIPDMWMSPPIYERQAQNVTATADLVPPQGLPFMLERSDLRITFIGAEQAIEVMGCEAG